ncbi:MAG: type 1 periplasmic binding fold superfamily protein [Nonlabens sp.]
MKTTIKTLSLAAVALLTFSCSDDDDVSAVNEEEVITTVTYELVNVSDSNNVVTLVSFDEDGDAGPLAPQLSVTGTIMSGATYEGEVEFFNAIANENVTEEVEEESLEHEVFYSFTGSIASIFKDDLDSGQVNPLGLETEFVAGVAGPATLTITLVHEPMKPNNGTVADADGETDVEVTFNLTVE